MLDVVEPTILRKQGNKIPSYLWSPIIERMHLKPSTDSIDIPRTEFLCPLPVIIVNHYTLFKKNYT